MIVLVVIGLMLSTIISAGAAAIEAQRIASTKERLLFIMDTVDDYVRVYGYLPCPADPTDASTDTAFGLGSGTNTGTCSASNIQDYATSNVMRGMVPVSTLGIADVFSLDGWGRRISYVVDEDLTRRSAYSSGTASITVENASGTDYTTSAAVLVMSHGANGYGAWTAKGVVLSAVGAGTPETENTDATTDDIYVDIYPTSAFDDIVLYKSKWQLAQ
ncbi:MAG: hypothetical protein KDD76_06270 [Rickettsiales bacterium]|nr:hypothetical protein [Rickettsiales bacterium]